MRKVLFLGLFILLVFCLYSQKYDTIQVGINRKIITGGSEESVSGKIYYDGDKTTIVISEPLLQWMIVEDNSMLIYYPDELKAIKLNTRNPVTLPFFKTFIGVINENLGLAELGYTIDRNEVVEDTLFLYWNPPQVLAKTFGQHILKLKDNKIVYSEQQNKKGKILSKTIYSDYMEVNNFTFPLQVESYVYEKKSVSVELITYSNPIFNGKLPEEIELFTLPDNIEVNEIDW
ncbi:MAG: hypothetical protein K9M99_02315 [Candidatus Cloacimonetes bacterium]|nr:hypothetical protein [Candidatus Cloacimonadota bacterium]